jgi:hypothetical protein
MYRRIPVLRYALSGMYRSGFIRREDTFLKEGNVSIYIFSVEGCDTFKSAQLRKEGKGPNDIPSEAESPGYESRTAELAWAAFSCLE